MGKRKSEIIEDTTPKKEIKLEKETARNGTIDSEINSDGISNKEAKKVKVKKETDQNQEEEQVKEYKWWLDEKKDGANKWETLEHKGPYFPPPYVPHGIKMLYNGH